MQLKESYILITGGSLGIGKASAKLLIEAGANVAITGRDLGRVKEAADELGAIAIAADVSSSKDVERTYAELSEHFPKLDALINNAGIGSFQTLVELDESAMREVWETNVLGATLMAKHAAKLFIEQNYGNIINVASTAALKGFARGTSYASTKFALRGLSECWRAELRPHNVRVVTICPSEVTTAFNNPERHEREMEPNKLRSVDIAHTVKAALEMDDRGFIPELNVFATNPF